MARRKPTLSAEFLAESGPRLDAIGPYEAWADHDNLDLVWERPAALAGMWVPLGLCFHTDAGSASFDPDARMFGLWGLFVAKRDAFDAQLRAVAAGAVQEMGPAVRGQVVVYREGSDDDGGGDYYSLQVRIGSPTATNTCRTRSTTRRPASSAG